MNITFCPFKYSLRLLLLIVVLVQLVAVLVVVVFDAAVVVVVVVLSSCDIRIHDEDYRYGNIETYQDLAREMRIL